MKAVFFDKAGNVQAAESQVKYLQTSVSSWQTLELSFTASQNGYLQVYVANESDQEVFFDELEVAHPPTLIAQENHYYPYGMNMVGIEKQGMPHHRFQFNAQTERETAFHLHWDETPFRRYDAQIGRFHGVDALASSYAGITPYQYGFNNPVMFNDPSGLKPTPGVGDGSSLSVTDRMFGDFLGGSSFSNRGTSATSDGWQRRQEQGEFERNLNPWDYTTNVTNIVKSKAFRGFDENANVLFQMASIVGGYDGGEDLPELRLRLITIYTHANLDKMRIEHGISQVKQAIYDGQSRFISRSLEYINLASTIADVAGIAGLAKAGGKFLARQALKRFGRRSVQTFDNVALSQAEQLKIWGRGMDVPEGSLKYTEAVEDAMINLGTYPQAVSIKSGVARFQIIFFNELKHGDIPLIKGALKANGATSVEVGTGILVNEKILNKLNTAYSSGTTFLGFKVIKTSDPQNWFILKGNL